MNDVLLKHFLPMDKISKPMEEVPFFEIISAIKKYTDNNFSWEVVDEKFIDKQVMTTVALYMPGCVLTGRSFCDVEYYGYSHLHALTDAFKVITGSGKKHNENTDMPKPQGSQMSIEDIKKATNKVNSNAEFMNYKDEHNKPTTEVPIDAVTEEGNLDILKKMGMDTSEEEAALKKKKAKKKKFTEEQIKSLRQIKIDFEITSDEEFGKLIHTWSNGKFSSKKDITPNNADDFINYVYNELGEA